MNPSLDKTASRNLYQLVRSHIGSEYAAKAAASVAKRFLEHVPLTEGAIIAGYLPITTELSPLPLMEALCAQGYQCAVPTILNNDAPLAFCHWSADAPLVCGPLGIDQPANMQEVTPDIIITPLVASTKTGVRLGYGKGFYDRTIEKLRAEKQVLAVGVCFACQIAEDLPSNEWDQQLDMIITERGVHLCIPQPST